MIIVLVLSPTGNFWKDTTDPIKHRKSTGILLLKPYKSIEQKFEYGVSAIKVDHLADQIVWLSWGSSGFEMVDDGIHVEEGLLFGFRLLFDLTRSLFLLCFEDCRTLLCSEIGSSEAWDVTWTSSDEDNVIAHAPWKRLIQGLLCESMLNAGRGESAFGGCIGTEEAQSLSMSAVDVLASQSLVTKPWANAETQFASFWNTDIFQPRGKKGIEKWSPKHFKHIFSSCLMQECLWPPIPHPLLKI